VAALRGIVASVNGERARRVHAAFVAVICFLALFARPARASDEPGTDLRISLLTMSPGDQSFTKFGHDALLVEDVRTGSSLVYNYGTFVFDSPWLAIDFLRGNLKYWLSVSPLPSVMRHYAAERRSIAAQELRLEPPERARIAELLARTERSDARYYKYDYYRDNCATRVRDVIDGATGGRLRAASTAPAPLTYREETLRLTADDLLLSLGLDVAMGPLIDRPLTTWEAEFLPARLQAAVRAVRVPGPSGDQPLVAEERVLLPAAGRVSRQAPPQFWPALLVAGLGAAGLLSSLGVRAGRGSRWARAALSVLIPLLGFATGALGTILVGLSSLTDHAVTYFNANILLCTPFSLALVAFVSGIARGDERATRRARSFCLVSLVTSAIALVLVALPFFPQKNVEFVAFFLPVWLGATLASSLCAETAQLGSRSL
jgi:hypothetical protein